MNEKNTSHTFKISGMHCSSCVILIEEKIRSAQGVKKVSVSLSKMQAVIVGDIHDDPAQVMETFNPLIAEHGYALTQDEIAFHRDWSDFKYAVPLAIGFILIYVLLQKLGIVKNLSISSVDYGSAFIIGLIASVSTCLAVVGGLVLSLSAQTTKSGAGIRPQIFFHIGRLGGFFLLGGIIGSIGKSFHVGFTGTIILSALVGLLMIVLGTNLLDIFHFTKRLQFTLPKSLSSLALKTRSSANEFSALLGGVATFFLPCGFTQSMQVYTLSTGSFIRGGTTMLFFALGTLPVLGLLSFGFSGIHNSASKRIILKASGLVIIVLGLFNLSNALSAAGFIEPLFY